MKNEIKCVVREEMLFAGIRKPIRSREELAPRLNLFFDQRGQSAQSRSDLLPSSRRMVEAVLGTDPGGDVQGLCHHPLDPQGRQILRLGYYL